MIDPDVCIFCAARGCADDTAHHTLECPFTTDLWPVDDEMIRRDCACLACGEKFKAGECYANTTANTYPVTGLVNTIAAEWESMGKVSLTLCLPCAALGRPVES